MKERIVNSVIKFLASHRTNIHDDDIRDVCLRETDVIKHIHSGSHVIKTSQGFFRFCPLHTPVLDFYKQRIDYHLKLTPFSQEDLDFLTRHFSNNKYLLNFVNYSLSRRYTDNDHVGFAQKSLIMADSSYESKNRESFDRNLYDLAYYISADVSQYKKNRYMNWPETFSANRILAQEALAKLLGIEDMFPRSEFVNLQIGRSMPAFGVMMEASSGIYPLKLRERLSASITPNLQRELMSLNIHDVICNEKDHRPGNYHVLLDENGTKAQHVFVFDNDCRWTFFPTRAVNFKTYAGASFLLNDNGEINRPFMDKCLADRLMHISRKELYDCLSPFLNKLQLAACYSRVARLGKAIRKTTYKHEGFLLDQDDWDDSTIMEELSGNYGSTYLTIYYHWYERMQKEHPEIFNSFNINMTD